MKPPPQEPKNKKVQIQKQPVSGFHLSEISESAPKTVQQRPKTSNGRSQSQSKLAQFQSTMNETSQERRLMNYQKYQRQWDDYETQVQDYFKNRDLQKYGSEKATNRHRENFLKKNLITQKQPKNIVQMIKKLWQKDKPVDSNMSQRNHVLWSLAKSIQSSEFDKYIEDV